MRRRIPFPGRNFRPGRIALQAFRYVSRRRCWHRGCQSRDLGSAVIKRRGTEGCLAHVGMRRERPVSRSRRLRPKVFAAISEWSRLEPIAAVASMSRARGWAVSTAAPLRAGESRADSSRRGYCYCTTAQPSARQSRRPRCCEHVVSRSHGDKRETDGEDASRCGGPRCAESMLRECGANNQCRCGRARRNGWDAAAVGGDDWQQADSRGSGRGDCAHGSVIPRDPQSRGTGQPSGWRWTMSVRQCVQVPRLRNVPLVARVV